jgi:ribose transport system ATP-binding protein
VSDQVPLLETRALAKRFGSVVALRAASLRVMGGEVHALMGANGAGKSTLVKTLTGVLRPDAGTIELRGRLRTFGSPAQARRAGLVSVYQDPVLIPDLTVSQNLRLTSTPERGLGEWLELLGLDRLDRRALAGELPAASQRLLDLARALAAEPKVLILDEITAALPANVAERVFEAIRRWRRLERSVIFISHRMAEVSALCDRATVLRDGATEGVVDPAAGGEERIVSLMLGPVAREVARAPGRPTGVARRPGTPVLEVRDLRVGGALDGVSFQLRSGEVLGVAALEGQGQDELFECVAGLRQPDGGEILVDGTARQFRRPLEAIRAGLVLVPPDRLQSLLGQRPIGENVALPLFNRLGRWGLIDGRGERRQVGEAIRRLQIDTRARSRAGALSGGNQQKLAIARWLASGFRALLCLDPTRGIDIGTKREIYGLLRELAGSGASVLLSTSEPAEFQLTCDRVVVLFAGRIVRELDAAEADEPALLRAAHGLVGQGATAPG